MRHKNEDNASFDENLVYEETQEIVPEKVELPNSFNETNEVSNDAVHENKKHKKHHEETCENNAASFGDGYWNDLEKFKPTNVKLLSSGRILTIIAGCMFLFAIIMFFSPATNIKMKNPSKASFSFNNIYALLVYYSIAMILSFAGGIVLSHAEFKIDKSFKLKKRDLRTLERKEMKHIAGLTFVNRTVFVLSLSLIIVIAFFLWILSIIRIPVRLLEALGIL